MKRIFKFSLVALVAALAIVACTKNTNPEQKDDQKEEQKEEEKKDEEKKDDEKKDDDGQKEEEVKLAVDGKFAEWESIDPVAGDADLNGIILMKTQVTDASLFFYIEADASLLNTEKVPYANYLTLYLDCNGDGAEKITYWGDKEEGGVTYDKAFQIWLMTNGTGAMANWDTGFAGKGKIEEGVYKGEFCLGRADDLLKSKVMFFGAMVTDQSVEKNAEGGEEWVPGDTIGICPAQEEDMAPVK